MERAKLGFVIFSLLAVSCSGGGGSQQESAQQSSQSLVEECRAEPVGPASLGLEQNDPVGYNGVPWGATAREFLSMKQSSAVLPVPNSLFLEHRGNSHIIALLLETPLASFGGMSEVQYRHVPGKFSEITVEEEAVSYIFSNGLFCMAFSELDADHYDTFLADLKSKHTMLDETSFTYAPASPHEPHEVTATLFRRGETNTRVYLVKHVTKVPRMGMRFTSTSILYIPNFYYEEIRTAIADSKNRETANVLAREDRQLQQDRRKIQ